jgi:hypothetical protein
MLNRRVGNTGSEPTNPNVNNRIMPPMPTGGGAKAGLAPSVMPRGMKSGGKVGGAMKGGDMPFFASKAKDKMASKKKPARKPMTNYASGGMVKADGCAMKGKTRGREC